MGGRLENIQALRLWAALAVVIFHTAMYYRTHETLLLKPILFAFDPWGKIGVDVFFVISGFVIWHSTVKHHAPTDAPRFIFRRLARIYLSYWPALIFAAIVFYWNKPHEFDLSNSWSAITLLPADIVPNGAIILGVRWTLTYELIFYAVFALLMLLPRRQAMIALLLWGGLTLIPAVDGSTFLSPYVAEFAAGAALAATGRPRWTDWRMLVALGVIAVAFFVAGLYVDSKENTLGRVLTFGPFSVLVVYMAVALEQSRKVVAGPAIVELGNASYALYLIHIPILTIFGRHWQTAKAYPDLMAGSAIVASVLASLLWWWLWEKRAVASVNALINRGFRGSGKVLAPTTRVP